VLYEILKPVARALTAVLFRLEPRGRQHVPPTGPVLLVSNHSSVLDPPLIGAACPRQLTFMAKAELFGIPLFGRFIRALNARPVRREGGDARALKEALRVLEDGRALLVFPEGTRGPEGAVREGKPGAGMLAALSGAAVVPVYISGSGRALPRGAAMVRPAKVIVRFGAPLSFARPDAGRGKARYQEMADEMMRAIERLMTADAAAARAPLTSTQTRAWTPPPAATNSQGGSGQV
jgi:1-acyl-sn-glycerol-3-phosphate acyltransferase